MISARIPQGARHPRHGHAYRPDIDGLRAIAVLAVVLYHVGGFGVSGGFGGVDVFFVISGYLITSIIQREMDAGTFSLLNFYERRIRRIFPALVAVTVAVTLVSAMLLLPEDFKEYGKSLLNLMAISSNYYFMRKTGYFDAAAADKPLLHTWSLAVEEQFYVVFPLLLLVLSRFGRRAVILGLIVLAAGSFLASISALDRAPARAFFATPGRVWELLIGVLTAMMGPALLTSRLNREAIAFLGLALIAFGYFFYSDATPFPGPAALVFCLGAAFIIYAGTNGGETLTGRVLSSPLFAGIGLISYSVYLWHWPLIVFVRYRFPELGLGESGANIGLRVSLAAASLGLGFFSWRFIERPFRKRAGTSQQRYAYAWFLGLTAALIAVALPVIKLKGLPERWPREVNEMLRHRERPVSDVCKPLANSGLWPLDSCRIGPLAVAPDTLLWGDSHAMMLIDGFETALRQTNQSVIVASVPGCPPFAGVMLYGRSRAAQCRAMVDTVMTAIVQSGVSKVVMSARWAYYAEGSGQDMGGGQPTQLSPDGIGKNPEVFSALFEDTVRRLRALGREVVIIGPIPEHRFPVALAMARNLVWQQVPPHELPRVVFTERQRHVLPLLERLDAWPRVRVLYPDRLLCVGETCRYAQGAKPLYVDANHLSPLGIKLIASLIDEIFAAQPGQ